VQPAKKLAGLFFYMPKIILSSIFILLAVGTAFASQRYISLAPSTTEILFALGLDVEIVGVSSFCNYPAKTATKTKVGEFSKPNLEKIFSLKPDYIFCTGLEQAPIITELKRLNLNVYVADPKNIEELFNTINEIGKITGKTMEADGLIKKMIEDIETVNAKARLIPQEKKVKVFIEIWHEPLITAGKGSFIDELITLAGGINISHDVIRPYCNFSPEKVLSLNPGCIIIGYMDREAPLKFVEGRYGWSNIDAVKNKRVFNDINPDLFLRPGPRITEGLKEIYNRLYL
jgi:iron complex transport system substrate-binding protein